MIISTSKPFVRGRIADTAVPRSIHKYRNTDIAVAEAVSYNNARYRSHIIIIILDLVDSIKGVCIYQ